VRAPLINPEAPQQEPDSGYRVIRTQKGLIFQHFR
jgi:hypothetical protein